MVVALPEDSALREKLLSALRAAEVEVLSAPPGADPLSMLEDASADLVVVRRAQLPEDPSALPTLREEKDGPALVVVSELDDPVDRAQLRALGAARVVDGREPGSVLGSVVSSIAQAEREGGPSGPEVRGNRAEPKLVDFLSRSPSMRRFVDLAARVADADATLLITGETGVGKERLARAIHAESARAERPFVTVNCAALPESLLESQLFGHERGAFTGADSSHRGFFEQAEGGTVFLDEIGELPLDVQVKLLTVLQRHEVQRLGAEEPRTVDVRVMAATHQDLREAIAAGTFREDLYYRLNVVALEVPPLRERRGDLPDLVGGLIQYFRGELDADVEGVSERALERLLEHDWPGNMRELINVIERGMILCRGAELDVHDLPVELARPGDAAAVSGRASSPADDLPADWERKTLREVRDEAVARAEQRYLDAVLRETHGVVKDAAARAGVGVRALYDRMRRYGLRKEDYR